MLQNIGLAKFKNNFREHLIIAAIDERLEAFRKHAFHIQIDRTFCIAGVKFFESLQYKLIKRNRQLIKKIATSPKLNLFEHMLL